MKSILTVITILIAFSINAQNFQGRAIYKTSQKSTFNMSKEKNPGMDDKMQEEIRKRIQKMHQKTFILEFDKYNSTYKQEVVLKSPESQAKRNRIRVMSFGGSGSNDVYYKNTQEKRFANQTEIQGKRFLVKDKLQEQTWEMSSETKNIGKYTCYKATYSKEVESKNISIKNGESVEEVKKETIITTAWYTPQVPVSNGPGNYQGLPGLILEINDGKKTIVCTEIILNPKEKITILEPKKGKVVSQKKFSKIQKEKSEELMEKMKSRRGMDLGNGTIIKFGG
ncbi:MAG: GLPGLI family protein [Polaribacter sp.]|uniref:GLPGLI family protein n=1 Tax=Polaribacter sp. TaxID=1920175 RepID=UPI002F358B54